MIIKREMYLTISFGILLLFYILSEFWTKIFLAMPIYFIIGIVFACLLFFAYRTKILLIIKNLLKQKVGIVLMLFFIWTVITIIVSLMKQSFILSSFLTNYIGNFFNSILFPMLFSCCFIVLTNQNKILKKILISIYLFVFIMGFIDYFAINLNMDFLVNLLKFFVNKPMVSADVVERTIRMDYGIARVASICREPGEYAGFLIVSCPIFLYFWKTKEKIFKNKILDILLKKSLLILFLISLYLTQSPINIIFLSILVIIYICSKYKKKQIFLVGFIIFICVALASLYINYYGINASSSLVKRIIAVKNTISSIDSMVEVEPSFATRICSLEAEYRVAIDNPVFGVGYGNINSVWGSYVLSLPHSITPEVALYAKNKTQAGGASFLFKILAETGFVGCFILYYYWYVLYREGLRVAKRSNEKDFITSLAQTLFIYVLFSWHLYTPPIYLVYFGFLLGFVYKNKYEKRYAVIKILNKEIDNMER